jgi:membrane protease YdiL (CAAX protease family)
LAGEEVAPGSAPRTQRLKPSPAIGVGVCVGYVVVFVAAALAAGVDYGSVSSLAGTADAASRLAMAAAVCVAAAVGFTSWAGWWHPALVEDRRLGGWFRWLPVVFALAIVVGIDWHGLGDGGTARLVWLLAAVGLGGFGEELVFRGLALTAFRSRLSEPRVWLATTLLFALLHSSNVLLGENEATAVTQVVLAFAGGSTLYLIRRVTGTLWAAVAAHAAYDLVGLAHGRNSYPLARPCRISRVTPRAGSPGPRTLKGPRRCRIG